jgi:magnesium chelatase subunit ChlD-like protein
VGRNAGASQRRRASGERSKTAAAKKALSHRGAAADNKRHGRRWQAPQRNATRGIQSVGALHWPRTLIAKRQRVLQREHLRYRPREAGAGVLHCFLIDCSGSMLGGQRLARAKGVLLQLLQHAYQQRAQIAIISFAGDQATTRVYPTAARPQNSHVLQAWLQPLGAGGGTPFASGVTLTAALLNQAARRNPAQQRVLWLLTDGRSRELPDAPAQAERRIVVDCEQQRVALGRCRQLAQQWQAEYRALNDLLFDAA